MRIVSWNMHRRKEGTWEYIINSLNPDFAFLQETSPMNEFNGGNNFPIFDRLSATVGNFVILII